MPREIRVRLSLNEWGLLVMVICCSDVLYYFEDLREGTIGSIIHAALTDHLATCTHCTVVVQTMNATIDVFRCHMPCDLSAATQERIRMVVMRRCKKC